MKSTTAKKTKAVKARVEKVAQSVAVKLRRQFDGVVVNAGENKTIRVEVRSVKTNDKYKKQFSVVKKYPVHDESRAAKVGDVVCFEECRPLSKTKRWRLVKVTKSVK
jgi:small subunit ribosomal protein S17